MLEPRSTSGAPRAIEAASSVRLRRVMPCPGKAVPVLHRAFQVTWLGRLVPACTACGQEWLFECRAPGSLPWLSMQVMISKRRAPDSLPLDLHADHDLHVVGKKAWWAVGT